MKENKFNQFGLCIILSAVLCFLLVSDANAGDSWKLDFKFGTYSGSNSNIYVIWAENPDEGFYYPIYICEKLTNGSLTGTVLPYWHINKYPQMDSVEIDAVTRATIKKQDFSVSFEMPADAPDEFTVYFETDVYYNGNDWFYDQPAILYKTEIDRNNMQTKYTLEFIGWTPNETDVSNENQYKYISQVNLVLGALENETRYITNLKDKSYTTSDVFLGYDARAQSDALVDSIIVTPNLHPPRAMPWLPLLLE